MKLEEALNEMRQGKWVVIENGYPMTILKNYIGVEYLLLDKGIQVENILEMRSLANSLIHLENFIFNIKQ